MSFSIMIPGDTGSERGTARCPDSIAVIGGGRWARVLTDVLCTLVPPSTRICVHSRHNAGPMSNWISERGLGDRIHASSQWPQFDPGVSSAAIVVNAARDHEEAVERALSASVPVLVEKPIAPTAAASQRLAELARSLNVRFAAAHVFLFARYLERFRDLVARAGPLRSLRIHWVDPRDENRYGEQKRYDPSLPVFADCLPHVLSIAGVLTSNAPQICRELKLLRGGAQLELDLRLGAVPCSTRLARNADRRERFIEVIAGEQVLQLDFSTEPGIIICGSAASNADPDWATEKRPVARMLAAFLQWAAGGDFDNRLSVGIGVQATRVIEQATGMYRPALMPWMIARLEGCPEEIGEDLLYALSEVLQADGPLESHAFERQVERVRRQFAGADGQEWSRVLANSRDPSAILRAVATTR